VVVDVVDVVGANSEWIESEISKTLVRYTYSVYHTICHVFVSYIDPFKDIKIGTYCTKRVMTSHKMTVNRRKNNRELEDTDTTGICDVLMEWKRLSPLGFLISLRLFRMQG
jgi:hypothetical protein